MKKFVTLALLAVAGLISPAAFSAANPQCTSATINLTKTGPATANWSAGTFSYTVGYGLSALVTAGCQVNAIVVTDTLPAASLFVSAVAGVPANWTIAGTVGTSNPVTFTRIINPSAAESDTFTITVSAPSSANTTTFHNSVTVSHGGTTTVTGTFPATWDTLITPVELQHFQAE